MLNLPDHATAPLVIRTQYGDDSIALVQWVNENKLKFANKFLKDVNVVYVDTGFAAQSWEERIQRGEQHAKDCGFLPIRIKSSITFAEAVRGRGEFPSSKFQWCSALLKGLPFLDWLDGWDIIAEAIILIAKRKDATIAHQNLPEWIEKCEFHNFRKVWHAILNIDEQERNALLERAGFQPLNHRSLECEPCVNSTCADLTRMHVCDKQRIEALEKEMGGSMIHDLNVHEFNNDQKDKYTYLDLFYRGCGNHFGCGL